MKNIVKEIKAVLNIELDQKWNMAWVHVPDAIAQQWSEVKSPRIRVQVGDESVVCALIKQGGRFHFMMGKYTRKKLGLESNQAFDCMLSLEESRYGMDLPIELAEMMEVDPEGNEAFHRLTPGRQRSAIHFVAKAKQEITRVNRAVLVFDNLKLGFTEPRDFTRKR